MAWRSFSFVYTLYYLIITIIQTYLKASNLKHIFQVYSVEYVFKVMLILSSIV